MAMFSFLYCSPWAHWQRLTLKILEEEYWKKWNSSDWWITDLYRSMRIKATWASASREPFFKSTMSSGVPHKINTVGEADWLQVFCLFKRKGNNTKQKHGIYSYSYFLYYFSMPRWILPLFEAPLSSQYWKQRSLRQPLGHSCT